MKEQGNFKQLAEYIIRHSESKEFTEAAKEWRLFHIELTEDFGECVCGHAIKEHCYIRNQLNGNEAAVGNVCINKFMGMDTGAAFAGIRRIKKDQSANANEDLIKYAAEFNYIYENEHDFLLSTKRKRKLSDKQISWKRKINWRILNNVSVAAKDEVEK